MSPLDAEIPSFPKAQSNTGRNHHDGTASSEFSSDATEPLNCSLYKLPSELVYLILRFATSDVVTHLVVRQTSRLLRSMTCTYEYRDKPLSTYHTCGLCDGWDLQCAQSSFAWREKNVHRVLRTQGQELGPLLRDRYCGPCSRARLMRRTRLGTEPHDCKFEHLAGEPELYCSACLKGHSPGYFTAEERQKGPERCRCIGSLGHVRLCEHEVVTWADLRRGLSHYKGRSGFPMGAQYQSPIVIRSCNSPSHGSGCSEGQVRPEAVLRVASPNMIVLRLQWQLHINRKSVFGLAPGPKLEASVLRTTLQKHRRGVGEFLAPSLGREHLPEMDCFRTPGCMCLSYEDKHRDDATGPGQPDDQVKHPFCNLHASGGSFGRTPGRVGLCTSVFFAQHTPSQETQLGGDETKSPSCLMVSYHRWMDLLPAPSEIDKRKCEMVPTHDWYHAVERSSYRWDEVPGYDEGCADQRCQGHYAYACEKDHPVSKSCCSKIPRV